MKDILSDLLTTALEVVAVLYFLSYLALLWRALGRGEAVWGAVKRTSFMLILPAVVGLLFFGIAFAAYFLNLETEPVPRNSLERVKYGQFYDLQKYEACRKESPNSSNCEKYRVVRKESAEYWPNPKVQPPKWPDPPAEPTYRKGMSREEYFKALCEKEAGEFIYKTVEGVDGVYQIRPRELPHPGGDKDKYSLEDPYGLWQGDQGWDAFRRLVGPTDQRKWVFLYLERPIQRHPIASYEKQNWHTDMWVDAPPDAKFARYFGNKNGDQDIRVAYSSKPVSRYGFNWREIQRPNDLELGVRGGELMVVDLQTAEVLGVRRGFISALNSRFGVWQGWSAAVCPSYSDESGNRGRSKDSNSVYWFVTKVLKPKIASSYLPDTALQ